MKRCSACQELKPLTDFSSDRSKTDGVRAQCKPCRNARRRTPEARAKERLRLQTDPAHRAARLAAYRRFHQSEKGKAAARRHEEAPHRIEKKRAYRASVAGVESMRRSTIKYREQHPERTRAARQRYHQRHPEEVRATQQRFRRSEKGRQSAERQRPKSQAYRKSVHGRAIMQRNVLAYRRRFPERDLARRAVRDAIRTGELVRPPACSKCPSPRPQAHHHRGYEPEFWLDVEWLCRRCHVEAHH